MAMGHLFERVGFSFIFCVLFGGIILLFRIIPFLFRGGGNSAVLLFILFSSLIPLAVLMVYRIKAPYACNNDFRFILPIMIPLSFIYVEWLKMWDKKWMLIKDLGISLAILMAFSSLLFFVSISGYFT